MTSLRWFARPWFESRGDEFDDWGPSTWYFETESDGTVVRQVEVYGRGQVLRYDRDHQSDRYGALGEAPLMPSEFDRFAVAPEEFDRAWGMPALNRPAR